MIDTSAKFKYDGRADNFIMAQPQLALLDERRLVHRCITIVFERPGMGLPESTTVGIPMAIPSIQR
jgi:hypothetical protein